MTSVNTTHSHITVLLTEAVEALSIVDNGHYVDGTFGRGGHSKLILSKLGEMGKLTVYDKDPLAIETAQALAATDSRVTVIHDSFSQLNEYVQPQSIDGVLLDLGVSSPQIDDPERGFSFRFDSALDMRMDNSKGMTAAQWINEVSESELYKVLNEYGEEKFSKSIAKKIIQEREISPIETTFQLANIVASQIKKYEKGQHPATRSFQAIRIAVNQELLDLEHTLERVIPALKIGGRLAVISFHSLEDRMVKRFMTSHSKIDSEFTRLPIRDAQLPKPSLKMLKRVKPSELEVLSNPRARSSILRTAEKLGEL